MNRSLIMFGKKFKNFTFVAIQASDFQTEVAGVYESHLLKHYVLEHQNELKLEQMELV